MSLRSGVDEEFTRAVDSGIIGDSLSFSCFIDETLKKINLRSDERIAWEYDAKNDQLVLSSRSVFCEKIASTRSSSLQTPQNVSSKTAADR